MAQTNGLHWWDQWSPYAKPVISALAPFVLRAALRWYSRRSARDELTRREYLFVWARLVGFVRKTRRPFH